MLGRARIDLFVESEACGAPGLVGEIARLHGAPEELVRGDRVEVEAVVGAVHLFANPELGDPRVLLAISGGGISGTVDELRVTTTGSALTSMVDRARIRVRRRIEASYSKEVAPLARALVLGETDLADSDREAFRASGLAHLLAVSGTHLVIVVLSFMRILTAVVVRLPIGQRIDASRIAAAMSVPMTWLYADFAGGSGSADRAAAMLTCGLVARAAGSRPSGVKCLAVSLGIAAIADPLVMCDASFALSVAATGGLLWAANSNRDAESPRGHSHLTGSALLRGFAWLGGLVGLGGLVRLARATMAAQLACLPVVFWFAADIPTLGVFTNLIAAPLGELAALPACLLHALTWWAPGIERGAAVVGSGALLLVKAVAVGTARSALATYALPPPTHWQLAVVAVAIAARWQWPRARRWAVIAASLVLALLEWRTRLAGAPTGELRVSVLDVGQGDCILIDMPDGRAMLVDAGGTASFGAEVGRRALLPVLRARRRSRIDVLVITHPHADHYLGLAVLMPHIEIGKVWDNGTTEAEEPDGGLARLLLELRRRGTEVLGPERICAGSHAFGAASVAVLAPCPRATAGSGHNDNSIVLRVAMGRRAALLLGDVEHDAEASLLETHGSELQADFLKVAHHGGRTSTAATLVDAIRPDVAAISVGVRNRFGHPHPETLAVLEERCAAVARTDRHGAIRWETDGDAVRWTSFFSHARDRSPWGGEACAVR